MSLLVHSRQSKKPADHARRVIAEVVRGAPEPVLFSCVRLTRHRDPAALYPVVAQADLDLDGRTLRVRAGARTPAAAVDLLAERVRRAQPGSRRRPRGVLPTKRMSLPFG